MEDKQLNALESIRLIEQTLRRSSQRLESKSIRPLLLWGYITVAVALLVYCLLPELGSKAHFLWALIPTIGYPLTFAWGHKRDKERIPRAFVERFISTLWLVLGLSLSFFTTLLGVHASQMTLGLFSPMLILYIVILTMSIGMLITGICLRIGAYKWGAIVGYTYLALSLFFSRPDTSNNILIFALVVFFMMCLPGHYLHYKSRKQG